MDSNEDRDEENAPQWALLKHWLQDERLFGIAAGAAHTLFLVSHVKKHNDNSSDRLFLYSSGSNTFGQLGQQIGSPSSAKYNLVENKKSLWCHAQHVKIATGDYNSFILTLSHAHQQLLACGLNDCGQLGTGDTQNLDIFTPIAGPWRERQELITQIIPAGAHNTFVVTNQGRLYGCGKNFYGQPASAHCTKDRILKFTEVRGPWEDRAILRVAAGNNHLLVLTADGLWKL
jgi:alpha-tubulin suppressor-like RCC1 family protein